MSHLAGVGRWVRDLLGRVPPPDGVEKRKQVPDRRRRGLGAPMTRRFGLCLAAVTVAWTTFVFSQADRALDKVDREATERSAANHAITDKQRRLNAARVDQACRLAERRYLAELHQLEATYGYVTDPAHQRQDIFPLVLRELPRTEQDVRLAHPPRYCAKPGVGLPHRLIPDVPQRPKAVQKLLGPGA